MKKLIILAVMVALVSCSYNVVVKPDRPDFVNKVGEVWIENDKIFSVGVGQSQNISIATTKARMDGAAYISEYFSKKWCKWVRQELPNQVPRLLDHILLKDTQSNEKMVL